MANTLLAILLCVVSMVLILVEILDEIAFPYFFIANYFVVKRLRLCIFFIFNKYCDSKEHFLQQKKKVEHEIMLTCFFFFIIVSVCIVRAFIFPQSVKLHTFLTTFFIWCGIFYLKKLTNLEIAYITSNNNLSLGYGAAIWYYKNYLDKFVPNNFVTRKKKYESKHGILLPNKLYILCPKSCVIPEYIDNTDNIQHCKELPPLEMCHGGVGKRIYNISVYKIDNGGNFFRCALEYAQPLKHLLTFKEDGKITQKEMCIQRDLFCENLKSMLRDGKNSHEKCELIEYDDEVHAIHDVLLSTASIQEFMQTTKS